MTGVLALDTSSGSGRVALVEGSRDSVRTLVEVQEPISGSLATRLFAMIDRALAECGWSKDRIDALAVVRGPGSFTGVRIGLGTAQGLALACDCPCVGVHTLEALAEASGRCPADRHCVLGAGRGELYHASFDAHASPPLERSAPSLVDAVSFWRSPPGFVLWGEGADPPAPGLAGNGRPAGTGTAAAAGRIAILRGIDAMTGVALSPLYVRPSDAEIRN